MIFVDGMDPIEALGRFLQKNGLTLQVGLRQQGHLPTVERMLAEGASWEAIGQAIGWHGETARQWYQQERGQDPGGPSGG